MKTLGKYCEVCEETKDIQVHHIITQEEGRLMGASKEVIGHPANLMFLCQICHSALNTGRRKSLLISEENNELKSITVRLQELSQARERLKKEYHNIWDSLSYQEKKKEIDKLSKDLRKREKEIRDTARIRMESRRQKVLDYLPF